MAIDIARRKFITALGGAAFGTSLPIASTMIAAQSSATAFGAASNGRTVRFRDKRVVPALSQGSAPSRTG